MPFNADTVELLLVSYMGSCPQVETPSSDLNVLHVLQAFYVPFAFLGISLISGNDWLSDVLGILAGHL